MIRILFGIFVILHGLVHLLYAGQSKRFFALQPGMIWPDGSWLLSRFSNEGMVRDLTTVSLILAALLFVAAGVGILWHQPWQKSLLVGAALFSSLLYLALWDGAWANLDDKGGVGLLINAGLATAVFFI